MTTAPGPRQLACLHLAAQGLEYTEIAEQLHITRATVATQMTRARDILGARNTVHAVHIAHQRGLLGEHA